MNAAPLLGEVARRMAAVHLEAVLIGNAAAALQGAPVTTIDFDFLFRRTRRCALTIRRRRCFAWCVKTMACRWTS